MAGAENYSFRLDEFGSIIETTWKLLLEEKDFCDVTLACSYGEIKTHKIIISHSSPVLTHILKQNLNKNPVIYVNGVKYKNLVNLLSFKVLCMMIKLLFARKIWKVFLMWLKILR